MGDKRRAVLCCAAAGACKQQAKYKQRPEAVEPRIPSTGGNIWQNWRSGIGAVQNGEEIASPNRRTAGGADLGKGRTLFFPAKPLLIRTI
jgi:hypothetical protein